MPFPEHVSILGTLPPALKTALQSSDSGTGITSTLTGVSTSPVSASNRPRESRFSSSPCAITVVVAPDAEIHFTDARHNVRWSARVRLLSQAESNKENPSERQTCLRVVGSDSTSDGTTQGTSPASATGAAAPMPYSELPLSQTLEIVASSWRTSALVLPSAEASPLHKEKATTANPTVKTETAPVVEEGTEEETVTASAAKILSTTTSSHAVAAAAPTNAVTDGKEVVEKAHPSPAPSPSPPPTAVNLPGSPVSPLALTRLTGTKDFHFYVDQSLAKSQQHADAPRMSLGDILSFADMPAASSSSSSSSASAVSPFSSGMQALIEPLVLDIVHFLAPAPRSLRDVLQFVFGALTETSSPSPQPAVASNLYFSFHHCPRQQRYRENFSLSDVKHLTDLLCAQNHQSTNHNGPTQRSLLHLGGIGYSFLDLEKYESKLERQRAANRAYTPLAELVEQSRSAAAIRGTGAKNCQTALSKAKRVKDTTVAVEPSQPRLVLFQGLTHSSSSDATAPAASVGAAAASMGDGSNNQLTAPSPLIKKYFEETAVANKVSSMELFVDRDTVLAVKSKGGGIMQGLGKKHQKAARDPLKNVAEGDEEGMEERSGSENGSIDADSLFRDASLVNSDAEGDDGRKSDKRRTRGGATTLAQYTSLQDTQIAWGAGDLSTFLAHEQLPQAVAAILTSREEARKKQKQQRPNSRKIAKKSSSDSPAAGGDEESHTQEDTIALDPFPIATATDYAQALEEFATLQHLTLEITTRLQRYGEVCHEARAWTQQTDRMRWAPSFTMALKQYFDRNGEKAAWLSAVAQRVGDEAYRLERELKDFVALRELGVLPAA